MRWRAAWVVVILASARASAAEPSARLVYTGATCSEADLAAALTAKIGRDPFTRDGELVVAVAVEAEAGMVSATIESASAPEGTRRLKAASCRELTAAMALVIAMVLAEPDQLASDGVGGDAKLERAPKEGNSEALLVPARASRPVHLDAIIGGATSDRLWPQAYVGVRVRRGGMSGALELAADIPDSFAAGTGRVTIDRAAATLAPCAHRGAFAGCVTLSAGVFRGTGDGYMDSRSAAMPLAVAGGRLTWEQPVTERLQLHVRGEAGGFLTRNHFLIDDTIVWSAPRVEGRLGIGVVARFP
jgi:hypothetical protein